MRRRWSVPKERRCTYFSTLMSIPIYSIKQNVRKIGGKEVNRKMRRLWRPSWVGWRISCVWRIAPDWKECMYVQYSMHVSRRQVNNYVGRSKRQAAFLWRPTHWPPWERQESLIFFSNRTGMYSSQACGWNLHCCVASSWWGADEPDLSTHINNDIFRRMDAGYNIICPTIIQIGRDKRCHVSMASRWAMTIALWFFHECLVEWLNVRMAFSEHSMSFPKIAL